VQTWVESLDSFQPSSTSPRPFHEALYQHDDRVDGSEKLELWTTIDGIVRGGNGEQEIGDLIREMCRLEEGGRRLAVGFAIENNHPVTTTRSTQHTDIQEGAPSTPPPQPPVPLPIITSVAFRNFTSTLDVNKLLAYVDLVTQLVGYATNNTYNSIKFGAETFRDHSKEGTSKSLEKLLKILGLSTQSIHTLVPRGPDDKKNKAEDEQKSKKIKSKDKEPERDEFKTTYPFLSLTSHIYRTLQKSRGYMPTFIQRYAEAGGFLAVPRSKVYELLLASDRTHQEKPGSHSGAWRSNTLNWLDDLSSIPPDEDDVEYEIGPGGLVIASPVPTRRGDGKSPVSPLSWGVPSVKSSVVPHP